MKRTLTYITLASALLLTACDTTDEDQSAAEEATEEFQETPEDTETDTDSENEDDQTEDEENTNEDNEDSEEDEDVALEEQEADYLYEVRPDNLAYASVIEGKEATNQVALLTYDDAPDKYALEIAEHLIEHKAPAIFFVNGMYIESEEGQEELKQLHEMGFAIGNHTHTHPNLSNISEDQQTEEILKTSDLIEEIIGERPRFFRAPFGVNTDHSKQVVEEDGMVLMQWSYGYDFESEYMEADALADIMVNTNLLVPGANLLMHDREWTRDATPSIIEGLRDKGYEILDPNLIRPVNDGQTESEDESNA
ncbi:hypothetical protein GCM10008932_00020 [Alkalibacterium iburiense]|uniref:NodB homology domain-containing protein n=1 Tax=Alkalibacterium iburiense TaxID=290589 RepID=A0ABP3GNM6_9LACT